MDRSTLCWGGESHGYITALLADINMHCCNELLCGDQKTRYFSVVRFYTHSGPMRATLRLDDNICEAVRSLAAIERTRVGKGLSRLARRARYG